MVGFLSRGEWGKCVIALSSQLGEIAGQHEEATTYVEMLLHLIVHAFLELQGWVRETWEDGTWYDVAGYCACG